MKNHFSLPNFIKQLDLKKISEKLKYEKNHINGHLRGYTIWQAIHYVSKYYNIIDKEISDVSFFNTSRKKIIKKIFGGKYFILFYGGAFFALGKSRFL